MTYLTIFIPDIKVRTWPDYSEIDSNFGYTWPIETPLKWWQMSSIGSDVSLHGTFPKTHWVKPSISCWPLFRLGYYYPMTASHNPHAFISGYICCRYYLNITLRRRGFKYWTRNAWVPLLWSCIWKSSYLHCFAIYSFGCLHICMFWMIMVSVFVVIFFRSCDTKSSI